MVDNLLKAEPAFNACLSLIYRALSVWSGKYDHVLFDAKLQTAADAAIRTDCGDHLIRPHPFLGSGVKCACRACIDACPAELAFRILQRFRAYPVHAVKVGIAGQHSGAPYFLAHSNAAAAHYAEVVIAVEEGLSQDRHIPEIGLVSDFIQANEFNSLLQLAASVIGIVLAAHSHRELPHALAQVGTFVFPIAKKTGCWVTGQSQKHLQGMPSHLLQLFCACLYNHSILCRSIAGKRIAVLAINRDDAELAGADRLQVRVMAKRRHIRARFSSSIENGRAIRDRYLSSVDCKYDLAHVPNRTGKW